MADPAQQTAQERKATAGGIVWILKQVGLGIVAAMAL